MFRRLFIVLCIPLFVACNTASPVVPIPSLAVAREPSATPTMIPSATSTAVLPTASPQPTTDPNFFRDDFDGALDTEWSWVREDALNWSLTAVPGSLQINVAGGYVPQHTNSNVLLRAAPNGNFQIETQVTFRPADNFQFAGLIIYESDSNFIQAGRSYCHTYECVGEGFYMNHYQNGHMVKPDFGQAFREIDPVLLRLSRSENSYTFEVSTDGKIWFVIGNHTSDLQPLQVGLVTGQRLAGEVLPAVFEYFTVRSLP